MVSTHGSVKSFQIRGKVSSDVLTIKRGIELIINSGKDTPTMRALVKMKSVYFYFYML